MARKRFPVDQAKTMRQNTWAALSFSHGLNPRAVYKMQ